MLNPDTVLLVEDDADVSDALAQVLTDEGYVVSRAANGVEALEHLREHPAPAVILLDLMMPVMDGFEFRRIQRGDPRIASVPVLCISAGVMDQRIDELECERTFKKPLDVSMLLETIARFAAPRRA